MFNDRQVGQNSIGKIYYIYWQIFVAGLFACLCGNFLPILAYLCIWLKKSVNLADKNNIFGTHFIFKDRAAESCSMLNFLKNLMEVSKVPFLKNVYLAILPNAFVGIKIYC